MVGIASALVLGFLLATAYGAGFHLLLGGPARHILLYVLAAWLGFAIGHFLGDMLNIELLKLGALHLLSASIGSWIALITSWWLVANEARQEEP
ncbi:MAG: hypothetical protein R3E31_18960 [Chloroflexota bacterium]|nr:hypothetical protein [Anaerolineales bacterium]MCB8966164.1 hypothetical protein [Ardenticatenaceae bacterium]